jgi:hypothetical protein
MSLRKENSHLKELVAELSLKNMLIKKAWLARAGIWSTDAL